MSRFSFPAFRSRVVIIGGGIIGATTGLFLARTGVSVTLLRKGRVATEQSLRNRGWVREQDRDAAELPIMIKAGHLCGNWRGKAARRSACAGPA